MSQTIDQVYSDFNVQGVPASGEKKPSKAEIRALLKMIQNSSGQAVTRNTLTALNGVTPPNENYMGIVLTGSGAGYYYRSGGAWVFGRGFPDSVAVLENIAGTANAITADTADGVDPAAVQMIILGDPPGTNSTGAATITINGVAYHLKSASGTNLAAGDIIEGVGTAFFKSGSEWRQLFSSATGATFDHQGDYAGGTTYTEGQVVTGSDGKWYQLKDPSATGDDPVGSVTGAWLEILAAAAVADGAVTTVKLANGAVTEAKLSTSLRSRLQVAFETLAAAQAYSPASAPNAIRTNGYTTAGDGGGALYKKATSEPTHAGKFSITLADGVTVVWYELAEKVANVLAFGARHTEANNAPMIQAAIDWACSTLKGPVVFFPAPPMGQTYNVTETMTITKRVKIRGEHIDVQIYATMVSTGTPIFDVDGTVAPNLEDVMFEDITLRSNTTTRADAIAFNDVAYIAMRNVILFDVHNGMVFTGNRSFSNKFDNVRVYPKADSAAVRFATFTGGGQHHFVNCTFCAETGFRLDADSEIAGLVFTSCNFEQCTDAMLLYGDAFGVSLNGCYSEKNGSNYTFAFQPATGNLQAGISIKGCFFETDGEVYAILLGAAGKVEGIEIGGNYARDYTTSFIRFGGDVAGGEVTGNYIEAIPALYSNGTGTSIRADGNRYNGGDRNA